MTDWRELTAVVATQKPGLSEVLRDCLKLAGLGRVSLVQDPFSQEAAQLVRASDLVVSVLTDQGLDLVHRFRRDDRSPNPYIPILLIGVDVTAPDVEAALGFGAHDVLLLPASAAQMRQRLTRAVLVGRSFITTASYVGPCRRRNLTPTRPRVERRRDPDRDLADRRGAESRAAAMGAADGGWSL